MRINCEMIGHIKKPDSILNDNLFLIYSILNFGVIIISTTKVVLFSAYAVGILELIFSSLMIFLHTSESCLI